MDLSIVIPAYREAHKIAQDVEAASRFQAEHGLSGEVIVADDGSPDGTADAAEQAQVACGIERRVLRLEHRGKGYAVRQGVLASRGRYVMFADSGLCVPFGDVLPALEMLRSGQCDIAHGSRKMPGSVINRGQSPYRRAISAVFRWAVLRALDLPRDLTDTQCGFKVYRGEVARRIYRECVTDGFLFDLEVLIRARKYGYRVVEFPVHWTCDRDSRLRPSRILRRTLYELAALRQISADESRRGR